MCGRLRAGAKANSGTNYLCPFPEQTPARVGKDSRCFHFQNSP